MLAQQLCVHNSNAKGCFMRFECWFIDSRKTMRFIHLTGWPLLQAMYTVTYSPAVLHAIYPIRGYKQKRQERKILHTRSSSQENQCTAQKYTSKNATTACGALKKRRNSATIIQKRWVLHVFSFRGQITSRRVCTLLLKIESRFLSYGIESLVKI